MRHVHALVLAECLLLLPSAFAWQSGAASVQLKHDTRASPIVMQRGRRSHRIGNVVQQEIAQVIRTAHSIGSARIPSGLREMISVVDVDVSPDLKNARVKVSIIGDRKDKVSAVRWLRGNVRGLRHELAKRNRHMKRIPELTFDHIDVGAATDMMVRLEHLKEESEAAERARGELSGEDDELDLESVLEDEDAWLDDDEDYDDDF